MTSRSEGFTLIEVMLVVVLIAIISVVSVDVISDTLNESKFQQTVDKLHHIAFAMIGNSDLRENGARTSFGYLGDVGALPTTISALTTNPGVPAWAINTTGQFGIGWNGPYLQGGNSGTDYTNDAWGNAIVYNTAVTPPTLTSLGADGASGGTGLNQDITVTLPTTSTFATVSGYVTAHYTAYTGSAQVTLNAPNTNGNGVLSQTTYSISDNTGYFTFSNVPFGTRSISVTYTSPSSGTIGPVLITVDKPNYTIPPGILDTNP